MPLRLKERYPEEEKRVEEMRRAEAREGRKEESRDREGGLLSGTK